MWLCRRRVLVSCLVQWAVVDPPVLWTSSTLLRELGAPQLSARLEVILQPRRFRTPESRSTLVAHVRLGMGCLVCCGMGMGVSGMCEWGDVVVFASCACLMFCAAGNNVFSNVVDIFNVRAGTWSFAALSQARGYVAATSLPDAGVAIFAGGQCTSRD